VLQAADILLYNADLVPVGEDQRQHLELARDIAASFNRHINKNFFKLPESMIMKNAARVMSLREGTKKMSKSDDSDLSRINLIDDADLISSKIKKAKSDSIAEIFYDKENRPEVSNLLEIFAHISEKTIEQVEKEYQGKMFSQFKQDLAMVLIDKIVPLGKKIKDLAENNKAYVEKTLYEGAEKAKNIAKPNLLEVKKLCGFI
jgi:tryptophanyl-tRNA synthetase